MAKRIFEIAKELEIQSKAIVQKCQAEAIPNINNHMSSVSAGLEATIREWFSEGGGVATAVETTEHVDITKVRKKTLRKVKAKAKATPQDEPNEAMPASKSEAPAPEKAVVSAPTVEVAAAESAESAPEEPVSTEYLVNATAAPSAPARTDDGKAEADQQSMPMMAPEEPELEPVMNIPERPQAVAPAGPQLDVQKPAKLSGPKVVRIEAPERVEPRRGRGPSERGGGSMPMSPAARGGGGVGVGAGVGAGGGVGGDDDRSSRRNRRRGSGQSPAGAPGGGGSSSRRPGRNQGSSAKWREQDLAEREARLSRAGGFLRQRRRDQNRKQGGGERAATAADTGGKVKIAEPFTIKDLSAATGVKASDIMKQLFMEGVMATVNSGIEAEKAQEIMIEFGIELEVEEDKGAEQIVQEEFEQRDMVDERPRSPVVAILGHVDHGKTSLLDRIRQANVADGEAGGITQATSAFRVPVHVGDDAKNVVFVDTPGHEAFTAMRARGAHMTDIIVLVVAADDGVMPQTIESINHAKAAGVPIVVALNKIDKAEATDSNIQKIYGQLAEHELNPVEWGGQTEVVKTSAVENTGITDLLEVLDYQAQLLELKADFGGAARGTVIESEFMEGRGATANLLIQEGELHVGDFIVVGRAFGRVRDIITDRGERIKAVLPSTPVQISGIDELPDAGDRFYIVSSLKQAQEAAEQRRDRERERELAQPKVTLETMFSQMGEKKAKELRVVIKANVQGSVDVLKKCSEEISTEDVTVRVLHAVVGGITESDVLLADASGAVILGFDVIAAQTARQLAERKGVQIRTYQVIYDIVDDLRQAAEGLLEPEIRQEVLGHADVRAVFKVSKVGSVAGCYVTDGVIERNAFIRVTRDDIVIENDRVLSQLKRFKDDAKEVRSGQECGMKIEGYDDIKEGDILECYRRIEVKRTL